MENLTLPRAIRRGLSDEVLDALRKAIMAGEFRPGQWLVESVIAEQMQVSRGPLREALRRLQQEGLVTVVPNKGTRVTILSEEDVRELHALRALLEGFAVRQLCGEGQTPSAIVQLEKTLAQMHSAVALKDMTAFSQLDFAFHEAILTSTSMPRLHGLWNSLNGLLLIWLLSVQDAVRQCLSAVLKEHDQIVHAIKARDAREAERLLCDHILARGEQILQLAGDLERSVPQSAPPRRRSRV